MNEYDYDPFDGVAFVRPLKELSQIRGVYAFTSRGKDGSYNIYYDPSMSYVMQQKALEHEYLHIKNGDFDSEMTVDDIESRRH